MAEASQATGQLVTPFDVSGGVDEHGKAKAIDYNKLVEAFGTLKIDQALLGRFEKLTGHKPHRLLRRGMVFSHRDLGTVLDKYEKGIPFFLYTGRGPSSDSMHVGHSIPFEFTKWLQDVFNVPLVIMLTDDEKFYHNKALTQEDCRKFATANAKDILGIGFDMKKTFMFIDSDFFNHFASGAFNYNVREMAKRLNFNQVKGAFGHHEGTSIAEIQFAAAQAAPSFADSFPFLFGHDKKMVQKIQCLIPCAIDQDPYFRLCRDQAPKMKQLKPAVIHSVFLPSLKGKETKMSASQPDTSIWLSDTPKQIQKKINNSFSGGQDTKELQQQLGGRTEVDIPYQYLTFFLEDDEELEKIRQAYEKGEMLTGEIKKRCMEEVQSYVKQFQERRAKVTDEMLDEFLRPRVLEFKGFSQESMKPADNAREVAALKARQAELKKTAREVQKLTKEMEQKLASLDAAQ